MSKTICIINGKGGIGKDTLINALVNDPQHYHVTNISTIDPIKDMCAKAAAGGNKDTEYRKLLSVVKKAVDEYYTAEHGISYTIKYVIDDLKLWKNNCENYPDKNCVMFVHIREPENIKSFVEAAKKELMLLKDKDTEIATLLVASEDRALKNYGNPSDDLVDNYDYDYYYQSQGNIETDGETFRNFFDNLIAQHEYEYGDVQFNVNKKYGFCEIGETFSGEKITTSYERTSEGFKIGAIASVGSDQVEIRIPQSTITAIQKKMQAQYLEKNHSGSDHDLRY